MAIIGTFTRTADGTLSGSLRTLTRLSQLDPGFRNFAPL